LGAEFIVGRKENDVNHGFILDNEAVIHIIFFTPNNKLCPQTILTVDGIKTGKVHVIATYFNHLNTHRFPPLLKADGHEYHVNFDHALDVQY
jgi:hypothetical protein